MEAWRQLKADDVPSKESVTTRGLVDCVHSGDCGQLDNFDASLDRAQAQVGQTVDAK